MESSNKSEVNINEEDNKKFRTLDTKKNKANTTKKDPEVKKIPPPKKKIIKFYFANPFEYKM